jgi:hypothetical protein
MYDVSSVVCVKMYSLDFVPPLTVECEEICLT